MGGGGEEREVVGSTVSNETNSKVGNVFLTLSECWGGGGGGAWAGRGGRGGGMGERRAENISKKTVVFCP